MKKLTDVLREEGLITEDQLREVKEKQAGTKRPLQELLVEMGFLEEEDLVKISSKIFGMPLLSLNTETPCKRLLISWGGNPPAIGMVVALDI